MPRQPSGSFDVDHARGRDARVPPAVPRGRKRQRVVLHERPGCECGCGGGWTERAARTELGNVLARVRAGVWEPSAAAAAPAGRAGGARRSTSTRRRGCAARSAGVLGDKPIDANTEADYRWRLIRHLLPFFAAASDRRDRPRAVSRLQGAQAAGGGRAACGARRRRRPPGSPRPAGAAARPGVDPEAHRHARRDPRGGRRGRADRPQPGSRQAHEGPRSEAAPDVPGDGRARGVAARRPRTRSASPVLAVSADGRQPHARPRRRPRRHRHAAERDRGGTRPRQVDGDVPPVASSGSRTPSRTPAARAIVETLGRSGVRVSELCDLRIRDARLHDPDGSRFRIADAKTEAGVREVQVTPDLADVLAAHLRRVEAAGYPTGPDAHLFPNHRGGRMTRQRVGSAPPRGGRAGHRARRGAGPAAAAEHHAAHDAPHLHLDRAARQQLRREVGHEPGRPRRLEDDDGRLRAARAARRPLARDGLRRARQAR